MILKTTRPAELENYLKKNNWLHTEEKVISISIPGSGNMNYVVRVNTTGRSFILKQSMPYVEKYPAVKAPQERIATEYLFYQHIAAHHPVQQYMPAAIGFDTSHYILALEDAGTMQDGNTLYTHPEFLQEKHIDCLIGFINALHSFSHRKNPVAGFENSKMKVLNATHIFDFPFQADNGFNLDTVQAGLQAMAMPFKKNGVLKQKVAQLREEYMNTGKYLLHGDYYPGSWLINTDRIKVIDPEFCFYGTNIFDLSVLIAHMKMAQCSFQQIEKSINKYTLPIDNQLLNAFTGIEILRRLIGLAQLPLQLSLSQKQALMDEAAQML